MLLYRYIEAIPNSGTYWSGCTGNADNTHERTDSGQEVYMKVLILSTGTGEGHNSAGKAVQEQFQKRGISCEMEDVLAFASEKAASYGKRIYVWSTVKATKVFKGAYRAGKAITSARRKSPVYYANALYAEKLYRYIVDNGYDTVVMPHLFPAEALTYMLRKHECRPDIHTYFVGTDYTCIPFTEETEADYYFIAHENPRLGPLQESSLQRRGEEGAGNGAGRTLHSDYDRQYGLWQDRGIGASAGFSYGGEGRHIYSGRFQRKTENPAERGLSGE